MAIIKPHPAGQGGFPLGELNKSFMSHSLNKVTRTYGGGSGYNSHARKPIEHKGRYKVVGDIPRKHIVKTVIHSNGRRLKKDGYVARIKAFSLPFVSKVEYFDRFGDTMTVHNENMN